MRRLLPDPAAAPGPGDLDEVYAWPEERCLRVNFVSSVDGAAALDGRTAGLGSPADKAVFSHLRATCDVVLVGAGTATAEQYRPAKVPIAVVSARLSPSPAERLFTPGDGTATPLVLTCASAPADRRGELAGHAEVVDCGDGEVDLRLVVAELDRRGMRRLLCEGGPRLFSSLLAVDAVDELCLTISPLVSGGTAPRITDGPTLRPPADASLLSVLEEDATLLMRYSLRCPGDC